MRPARYALLLLLTCAAHAGMPALQPGRPQPARLPAAAPLRELQARLDAHGVPQDCSGSYAAHEAQAWLNFALYAQAESLPAAVRSAGARAAADALDALESGSEPPAPRALPEARQLRADLWRQVEAAQHDGRRCAAPKMLAYCAVQLAWAGYEAGSGGWRHADPYLRIAEDYCATALAVAPGARAAARRDAAAAPEAAATAPAPAARALALEPEARAEPELTVHFAHDRYRAADITAPGRAQLRELARTLRRWPRSVRLRVSGHADLTGTDRYNVVLSERRARTVVLELRRLGVPQRRITLEAHGSSEPLLTCPRESLERRRYLDCLGPNRRVRIALDGIAPPRSGASGPRE